MLSNIRRLKNIPQWARWSLGLSALWHVSFGQMDYIDIDYTIFSEGFDAMTGENIGRVDSFLTRASPYRRATFRYAPILALATSLNGIFGNYAGRLVFLTFSFAVGCAIARYVELRSKAGSWTKFMIAMPWNANPLVAHIASRGNSDATVCLLVLVAVFLTEEYALKQKRRLGLPLPGDTMNPDQVRNDSENSKEVPDTFSREDGGLFARKSQAAERKKKHEQTRRNSDAETASSQLRAHEAPGQSELIWLLVAGFLQGLAVHLRLFPLLQVVPMVMALNPLMTFTKAMTLLFSPIIPDRLRSKCLAGDKSGRPVGHKAGIDRSGTSTAQYMKGNKQTRNLSLCGGIINYFTSLFLFVTIPQYVFLFGVLIGSVVPTLISYHMFGWSFLYEAYLYHFVRYDHRHNLSPFSAWSTLITPRRWLNTEEMLAHSQIPYWCSISALKLLQTLTNKVLPLACMMILAHVNLPCALFVGTTTFVAFQNVFTVQYQAWYLSLMPLAICGAPMFQSRTTSNAATLSCFTQLLLIFAMGTAPIALWVMYSSNFEFAHEVSAFTSMHFCNLLLLLVHTFFVIKVARLYQPKPHSNSSCKGKASSIRVLS